MNIEDEIKALPKTLVGNPSDFRNLDERDVIALVKKFKHELADRIEHDTRSYDARPYMIDVLLAELRK